MGDWMGKNGTKLFVSMVNDVKNQFNLTPDYGYVDSDVAIDAFLDVGVPAGHVFSIGNKGISRLGYRGSHAIVGPQPNPGFAGHIREFVIPNVPPAK